MNFLYLLKMIVTGRVRQLSREYIESCQGNHNEAISKQNPFSRDYDGKLEFRNIFIAVQLESCVKLKKGDEGYAQPVGLTKQRGEKAKNHIYKEIIDLVRHCIVLLCLLTRDL